MTNRDANKFMGELLFFFFFFVGGGGRWLGGVFKERETKLVGMKSKAKRTAIRG